MSTLDRATLKAAFQNGDQPQGSDYENLIDSFVSLAETTTQTMNGQLVLAGGVSAASVNAGTMMVTGTFSGAAVFGTIANFSTVSAQSVTTTLLTAPASGMSITGTIGVTGNVTVSGNITFTGFAAGSVDTSVACISTAQASARLLTAAANVIASLTTAANDSVRLPGLYPGVTFVVINDTTGSAKVFPPTGGQINALGSNAALDLGPRTGTICRAIIQCISSTQAYALRGS